MKKHILIYGLGYGLGGGVLIVVLKLIEYRFLVIQHSIEIYGGLVALSLRATTSSKSARVIGKSLMRQLVNKVATSTHPPGASVSPRRSGWWRKCLLRYLLIFTSLTSSISLVSVVVRLLPHARRSDNSLTTGWRLLDTHDIGHAFLTRDYRVKASTSASP
ncbi:MAG TPA: hypothetical protein VN920_01095 [Pyrinomonadaceae bacterium]|nr:hypothetical protein [Pyrinomonadaceae bacterium]